MAQVGPDICRPCHQLCVLSPCFEVKLIEGSVTGVVSTISEMTSKAAWLERYPDMLAFHTILIWAVSSLIVNTVLSTSVVVKIMCVLHNCAVFSSATESSSA
jgi:hypothetical protein